MWHPKFRHFLMAELKREKGRLSEAQKSVIAELEHCGVRVYVWKPSDWDKIEAVLKGKP